MRVLHCYKTALPDTVGGVEQVIDQLSRTSSQHGIRSSVFSLSSNEVPKEKAMEGYTLHRARCNFQIASTSFSWSAFQQFKHLAQHADLIHYHFPWPFMDLMHYVSQIKKPTVLTYHSDIMRQKFWLHLYRPLQNHFLQSMDRIVATSPNYLATSSILQTYGHKVSVIPIGLDKKSYPIPSQERLKHWSSFLQTPFFLFVGVLRYYKGLHILVEAAQHGAWPVVIVGAGPIEDALKKQAKKLGLNNLWFLGHVSDEDKVALITLCLAVVFPSHLRSEAFGISLLEGAMYGKPMISSEIGTGTTFINIANTTGLVVPPSNPQALHEAMNHLWNHQGKAQSMGKAAEERYWQLFTAQHMMASYASLYQEILQQKAPLASFS